MVLLDVIFVDKHLGHMQPFKTTLINKEKEPTPNQPQNDNLNIKYCNEIIMESCAGRPGF